MIKVRLNLRNVVAIAICLVGFMVFNSCGNDKDEPKKEVTNSDNGEQKPTSGLVGTWVCTDVNAISISCGTASHYSIVKSYTFKANETFIAQQVSGYGGAAFERTGTWKIENNILTLAFDDISDVYTTSLLTSTKFVYRINFSLNIPVGACRDMSAPVQFTYEKAMQ